MDSLSDEIESILFIAREVMVYKVPPRTSAEGYKAAAWDEQGFLWKGRLRVVETGEKCELRLEDASSGELFASTIYTSPWTSVEPVLDSSRYFVLRVEGEGGRRAFIGMGFLERGEAFDFQVALQTVAKRTSKSKEDESVLNEPAKPVKDYTLKEGQTFKISIPGREARSRPIPVAVAAGGVGGGFPLLPPPPPGGRKR